MFGGILSMVLSGSTSYIEFSTHLCVIDLTNIIAKGEGVSPPNPQAGHKIILSDVRIPRRDSFIVSLRSRI